MRKPNIAVLGATGVVGREILKILVENNVPYNEIKFLASAKSAGKKITFKGEEHTIIVPDVDLFPGHIACSSLSRSEIVVPLIINGEVKGVLDIDSDRLNAFDEIDQKYLEETVRLLAETLYNNKK